VQQLHAPDHVLPCLGRAADFKTNGAQLVAETVLREAKGRNEDRGHQERRKESGPGFHGEELRARGEGRKSKDEGRKTKDEGRRTKD
jgi:hypothetical protein